MNAHLLCLSLIHLLRAVGGLILAAVFLWYSEPSHVPRSVDVVFSRYHALEPGDPLSFRLVGMIVGGLSLIRLAHAVYTMLALRAARRDGWRRGLFRASSLRRSRRLGLLLAWIDLVDLTFFPVTTASGLYGLLVYRAPDIIDFFEARFIPESKPARALPGDVTRAPAEP